MKDIERIRSIIDQCDKKIVENLEKRFLAVKDVKDYKKSKNMPIFQSSREDEILKKIESYQESEEFLEEIEAIYIYIMNKSKEIQKKS